ncbi:DNA-binding transcriptional regulator, MarR family [Peptoclostridium litorale DSM 5388]|uniref:Transcriptional regulator, MarR family n=1 Tax=Peptoclostridium litorale DSM 5388 TaxID=1121324 RepID=A0A069RHN6_PEPLI|nr:MarR family transcriptional regulator [Peptoclostridium litorale]KDR96308.1 transcriptional regulator, MarR family [Peptoclostridium litorale DSM 5388]SIO26114.1 DNA-binding transcriptional regulator, MarR family [Peptoclostridium litorale DSM 5388]
MNDKYIVYFISKTKKKMLKFIEKKLKEKGLDDLIPSHGNVLTALYENGGRLTMKEIAKRIGKDKSTVTPLVEKLLKLGYVEKEKSQNDKRVTYIKLTAKGRQIESKYDQISGDVYDVAYRGFSDDEKEIFLGLLKRLNDNFTETE